MCNYNGNNMWFILFEVLLVIETVRQNVKTDEDKYNVSGALVISLIFVVILRLVEFAHIII